jgi:hypothetical protein
MPFKISAPVIVLSFVKFVQVEEAFPARAMKFDSLSQGVKKSETHNAQPETPAVLIALIIKGFKEPALLLTPL